MSRRHRDPARPPADESELRRMRDHVREYNIYGWAGLLLAELARMPAARPVMPAE